MLHPKEEKRLHRLRATFHPEPRDSKPKSIQMTAMFANDLNLVAISRMDQSHSLLILADVDFFDSVQVYGISSFFSSVNISSRLKNINWVKCPVSAFESSHKYTSAKTISDFSSTTVLNPFSRNNTYNSTHRLDSAFQCSVATIFLSDYDSSSKTCLPFRSKIFSCS